MCRLALEKIKMFLLVEFTDSLELAVVPDSWLKGPSCAVWPNFRVSTRIQKAVRTRQCPEQDWKSYPIRELYRHESYDKVRKKLKVAEEESDLQTAVSEDSDEETHQRRSKRKKRAKTLTDDESEDCDSGPNSEPVSRMPSPPPAIDIRQKTLPAEVHEVEEPIQTTIQKQSQSQPVQTTIQHNRPIQTFIQPRLEADQPRASHSLTPQTTDTRRSGTCNRTEQARDMRLFTLLEKIIEEQANQRGMLQSIQHALQDMPSTSTCNETGNLPEEISFPLESLEEVEKLEAEVADKSVYNSLVNYLSVLGGKDTADAVRRILRHTLNSRVAEKYNWYGKKGKLEFGRLNLACIIFKAVRKTKKATTNTEVELVVREWLRTAGDRDGGRKKRERKKSASQGTQETEETT